ncbi:MAG: CopG family transcriptional regulator [Hadesarchaea archaeon CG08_land_8_20_14_0_20_51_8]|nr:MAG: CopG family transcriptional regulator [Hadesarchaea archaeon CG08_land_8_20_14_0_20_51_8]
MPAKSPIRLTIALDENSFQLVEKLTKEAGTSRSELMRRALKFYAENKHVIKGKDKRVDLYVDMLAGGEHIVLDLDHWLLLLDLVDSSPKREKFWQGCKAVAKAHAEQLPSKIRTPEELLERLAACNFFRLIKNSDKEFTLVLTSEITKKFVKTTIEDFMDLIGFKAEVKEDLAKLRVKIV